MTPQSAQPQRPLRERVIEAVKRNSDRLKIEAKKALRPVCMKYCKNALVEVTTRGIGAVNKEDWILAGACFAEAANLCRKINEEKL